MSSAIHLNLDQYKMLPSGNGLIIIKPIFILTFQSQSQNSDIMSLLSVLHPLTLSQTTNFGLFQTKRVSR